MEQIHFLFNLITTLQRQFRGKIGDKRVYDFIVKKVSDNDNDGNNKNKNVFHWFL